MLWEYKARVPLTSMHTGAVTACSQDVEHTSVIVRSEGEPAIVAMMEALRDSDDRHESVEKGITQQHLCTFTRVWAPVHPDDTCMG